MLPPPECIEERLPSAPVAGRGDDKSATTTRVFSTETKPRFCAPAFVFAAKCNVVCTEYLLLGTRLLLSSSDDDDERGDALF